MHSNYAGEFRFYTKHRAWGHSEAEAEATRKERQIKWARRTKGGFESLQRWYEEHPDAGTYEVSEIKLKQYRAACAILLEQALTAEAP